MAPSKMPPKTTTRFTRFTGTFDSAPLLPGVVLPVGLEVELPVAVDVIGGETVPATYVTELRVAATWNTEPPP
jgi:hypothetical protein